MARAGDVFSLTDRETLTLRTSAADSEGELVEVAAEWLPMGHGPPPPHFHPRQDERFEVTEGELTVKLGKEERVLHAGEVLDIPRGTVHTIWNAGALPARATWRVRPALRTEDFWETMHAYREAGYRQRNGMIDLPAAALVFRAFRDEVRLALSGAATGPVLAALAVWARMRGYPSPEAIRAGDG